MGKFITRRKKLKQRKRDMQREADQSMHTSVDVLNLNDRLPTRTDLEGGLPTRSEILGIASRDPRLDQAQRDSLAYLQQVGRQGFLPQHEAALEAAMRQANRNARAQREGIMQDFRARGMGGSGMAMAAAMMAQQDEANRSADLAAQMGLASIARQDQANRDAGQFAGQIDSQRFGQEMGRGGALDAFNMQLAGARGAAAQQGWANQFGLAGAQSGANANAAGYYSGQAQQAADELKASNQAIFGGATDFVQGAVTGGASIAGAKAGRSTQPQQGWASGSYGRTPPGAPAGWGRTG